MASGQWETTRRLVEAAKEVLAEEQPMTLRQLFYRLVSTEMVENTRADYQRLSRVMTKGREDGQIPFEWMVDRSRPTYEPNVFENPQQYLDVVKRSYRRNYWQGQPLHVEIWTEKDAIIGSIEEVTDELGVTVQVGRGFNSATRANDIAQLFASIGKSKMVFYLGDHDPSGRCIEAEAYERIKRYGSGPFQVKRLAVHAGDIKRYKLPPLRVKDTDSRAAAYRERYGDRCVELDALPPAELRRRIRRAVESVMDIEAWNRAVEVEKVEHACISDIVSTWPTVMTTTPTVEEMT
jgi:hypothetical protein